MYAMGLKTEAEMEHAMDDGHESRNEVDDRRQESWTYEELCARTFQLDPPL